MITGRLQLQTDRGRLVIASLIIPHTDLSGVNLVLMSHKLFSYSFLRCVFIYHFLIQSIPVSGSVRYFQYIENNVCRKIKKKM